MLRKYLDHIEEFIIATLIGLATLLIFAAVLHRYSTGMSSDLARYFTTHDYTFIGGIFKSLFDVLISIDLSWSQELCIYMFVWMAKFGAAYGVRTGIHVGVDVFVNLLPPVRRNKVILFGLACGAIFTGIVGTLGAIFVAHIFHTGQQSNDLEVPMWIVYLAIPLGSYLMCFRFLQVAAAFARTGQLPKHDEGHVDGLQEELPATATLPAGART